MAALEPRLVAGMRELLFDSYQRLMPRERKSAPAMVVEIDERSLEARGQWPWPRAVMAELVRSIAAAGSAAIGVDVLFSEPDRSSPGADAVLAQAIQGAKVVLGIVGLEGRDRRFPFPPLAAPARVSPSQALSLQRFDGHLQSRNEINRAAAGRGLINADSAARGIRKVPLVARIGRVIVPALSVEMVRVAAAVPYIGLGDGSLTLGDLGIPLQPDGAFWIYYGGHDPQRFVSAEDVLSGHAPADLLRDKLVLIGVTGLGLLDYKTTPFGESIPGVEIHAQMLEQIFDGTYLRRPARAIWIETALLAAAGILCVVLVPSARAWISASLLAAILAALAAAGLAAFKSGVLIDVATPALGVLAVFGGVLWASLAEADRQRRLLREAQAKVEGELHAARRIQLGLLPHPGTLFASETRFALDARLEPARTVGGDFYDCFMVDPRRLFFVVADVSGKGLAASLFMALSKSLLKSVALRTGDDPGAILMRANAEIARDNPESLFVTAFAALLDAHTGELAFCNAGHEPPLVRAADGRLARLEHDGGPPLCVMEGFEYPTGRRALAAGEWLCVVTDGVTEAMNPEGELYGPQRLADLLLRIRDSSSPAEVLAAVRKDVARFAGAAEQSDDITLLCLRWNGAAGAGARPVGEEQDFRDLGLDARR